MKLVFKKDKDSQISVFRNIDDQDVDFSYVDMIKALIDSKEMAEPDILGDFTNAEKASINSMVTFINKELSASSKLDTSE